MQPRLSLTAAILAVGVVTLSGCSGRDRDARDTAGADTIAVPAAAVDTTRTTTVDSTGAAVSVGAPGAGTTESGRSAATGVDTPITRKLREGEKKP